MNNISRNRGSMCGSVPSTFQNTEFQIITKTIHRNTMYAFHKLSKLQFKNQPNNKTIKNQPELPKSEAKIQQECVMWFNKQFPQYRNLMWKNDNEGRRSTHRASIAKGLGLKSGVPDLTIAVPNDLYHGLYIEVKEPNGYLSANQAKVMSALESVGYKVVTVTSLLEFQQYIEVYFRQSWTN